MIISRNQGLTGQAQRVDRGTSTADQGPQDTVTLGESHRSGWIKAGLMGMALLGAAGGIGHLAANHIPSHALTVPFDEQAASHTMTDLAQNKGLSYHLKRGIQQTDMVLTPQEAAHSLALGRTVEAQQTSSSDLAMSYTVTSFSGSQQKDANLSLKSTMTTHLQAEDLAAFAAYEKSPSGMAKVLDSYNGVQGQQFYAIHPDKSSDEVISGFEAAKRFAADQSVDVSSAPLQTIGIAMAQGHDQKSRITEATDHHEVSTKADLLNLPPSYDAARDVWNVSAPTYVTETRYVNVNGKIVEENFTVEQHR